MNHLDAYGRDKRDIADAHDWAESLDDAALAAAITKLEKEADRVGIYGEDAIRLECALSERRYRARQPIGG